MEEATATVSKFPLPIHLYEICSLGLNEQFMRGKVALYQVQIDLMPSVCLNSWSFSILDLH
jgi:hypothetical protein